MVTYSTKKKKIRKVCAFMTADLAAGSDATDTIHTMTDPGTIKRLIINAGIGVDTFANDETVQWGICLTKAGETLPTLANIESEENRWLIYECSLAVQQSDNGGYVAKLDSKTQRKVKDGDVLTFVCKTDSVGKLRGSATIFIDES